MNIMDALVIASHAHRDQRRKVIAEPYINHPIRVAAAAQLAGLSLDAIVAAILHDVIEDTPITLSDLEQDITPRALHLVDLLTKWWDDQDHEAAAEYKYEYYHRILGDPEAVTIKVLDRVDNLSDMTKMLSVPGLKKGQVRWAERYARKTMAEFGPLIDKCTFPMAIQRYHEHLRLCLSAISKYYELSALSTQHAG